MNLDFKSNFLKKKKQQKQRIQQKIEQKSNSSLIQKNIRAFLTRASLYSQALSQKDLEFSLMIGSSILGFSQQSIYVLLNRIENYQPQRKRNYQKKLLLACMKISQQWAIDLACHILQQNQRILLQMTNSDKFINELQNLLKNDKGTTILNVCIKELLKNNKIRKLQPDLLTSLCLRPYQEVYLQVEGAQNLSLSIQTILTILSALFSEKQQIQINSRYFEAITKVLAKAFQNNQLNSNDENIRKGVAICFRILKDLLSSIYSQVLQSLIQKNKNFLTLIEDQQQLEYFENRVKGEEQFIQFCEQTLKHLQLVFYYPKQMHQFMRISQQCRNSISDLISDINIIYDAKNILWVYSFLSDDNILHSLKKQKSPEFYVSLKMKVLTMDDQQFFESSIFPIQQWQDIIQYSVAKAFQLGKAIVSKQIAKKKTLKKLIPFEKKGREESQFKTLSELLNNLYKKCLRTKKISEQVFINKELDKLMNSFIFGVGARALEMMLKNFPFVFRFETRMKKFKEFIKEDKKNHDRSLFYQEQIDEDLIVNIRRGHQFLDAFQHCLYQDLRKKYKIVFFNQQGLEEQGIDGGGIIKQFINRVLKSSFSEVFGMFYETQNNEILPNTYSPSVQQYEFIGKIVGKAVYEGINIEYKFAQPFLNLLIGRQNSFQDLQYIDKQIYQSLLSIKRYEGDISELQQTFTILDQLPNGIKKVINLKYPNKAGNSPQIPITNQNRLEFIMSYADFKCNKQLQQKTRLFRRGFLKVMKSEWLTMFSNQQLNQIISGSHPDFHVDELKYNVVLNNGYHQKSQTITDLWAILREFTPEEKSLFLLFITSCPRPPTLGFATMKPLICISRSEELNHLPTANTCMNVLRLPDYKNRENLKKKLLYAINAKAGFQFA